MESRIESSGREDLRSNLAAEAGRRIELSELYHARSRIATPRFRIHALLAVIPAARKLGVCTEPMTRDLRMCLKAVGGTHREPLYSVFLRCLEEGSDAGLLQGIARTFFVPEGRAELDLTRCLLASGKVSEARSFSAGLKDPVARYRARRLASTGIWSEGNRREFVAEPAVETGFPDSLPRFVALARSKHHAAAEGVLARLGGRDRQVALAHWAAARYRGSGLESGAAVVRSIRYESVRELAWLLMLRAALQGRKTNDAWRVLDRMRRGAHHERARLLTAARLIRQGRGPKARQLLSGPFAPARRHERDLLFAELRLAGGDAGRLQSDLESLRRLPSRAREDLADFDGDLPRFPHRRTLLALRAFFACEKEELLTRRDVLALAYTPKSVRCLLDEASAAGRDPRSLLGSLGRRAAGAVDPIRSEYVSLRCRRIVRETVKPVSSPPRTFPEAFFQGLRMRREDWPAATSRWPDATDPARCAFDEGVSLSQHAGERRRALIRAAKASLKTWLRESASPPLQAVRSRLRSLQNLGRGLASAHLFRALETAREVGPAYRAAAAALIALDPSAAARLLFHRHAAMVFAEPETAATLLARLEDHGAVEPGFTRLWMRLLHRVRSGLGPQEGVRWLQELVSSGADESDGIPHRVAVSCVLEETTRRLPATVDELVTGARRRLERTLRLSTEGLVDTIQGELRVLRSLLWLLPGAPRRGYRPWSESEWAAVFRRVHGFTGKVDATIVRSLARRTVPSKEVVGLVRRWLLGRFPIAGRSRVLALPQGASPERRCAYRLRYLDKRRDLFTYLRFADCVPCCFNSADPWYRWRDTATWVQLHWKDPLSFCFHVERRDSRRPGWQPCGFIAGGYALLEGSPALLLNGLYLRKQHRELRFAILAAIEREVCLPLGIRRVALANLHGGHGDLPESYARRGFAFHRLRALRTTAGPVTRIYDDLTREVNRTSREEHLFWKRL